MPRVFMAARLPDGGELTFRLSLTDSADPSGGNPRHPFEDKTLALFDELRTPLLRYVLSPHRETAIWETWHYPQISPALVKGYFAVRPAIGLLLHQVLRVVAREQRRNFSNRCVPIPMHGGVAGIGW